MRLNNWRHSTIVAGIISGILIGCGATALKHLIALISGLFVSGIHAHGANYILLAVPLTGIMLSGMMSRYVFKVPMEYATERIRNDISAGARRMKRRLTVAPILTSGVTLGCGGSAGAEGPIAYSGAAIANNVGRMFRIPANMLTVMIACGAGAGIAAIFKAPVGGMLFTIEVLGMELGVASILLLTAMCLTSALTAFILSGYTPDLVFHETAAATDIGFLAAAAVLGIFCGLYSLYYLNTGLYLRRRLQHIAVPWHRNLIALYRGVLLSGTIRRRLRAGRGNHQRRRIRIDIRHAVSSRKRSNSCGRRDSSDQKHCDIRHKQRRRCGRRFCPHPLCRLYCRTAVRIGVRYDTAHRLISSGRHGRCDGRSNPRAIYGYISDS